MQILLYGPSSAAQSLAQLLSSFGMPFGPAREPAREPGAAGGPESGTLPCDAGGGETCKLMQRAADLDEMEVDGELDDLKLMEEVRTT